MSVSTTLLLGLSALAACALLGAAPGAPGRSSEPIRIEVDRSAFELRAADPARPGQTLRLPVVVGSPAHPTPTGRYRPRVVVRNPGWRPGPTARARGARAMAPSRATPMGVAKIPLTGDGFTIHGGADPLLLGKPASLGCLRLRDADMLALLDWLAAGDALGPERPSADGERRQGLRRRVAVEVR